MIARYAGSMLGLLAFLIVIVAGLLVQNPVTVTLSRGILALFVFCIIGLVLGGAAQLVVAEYERNQRDELNKRFRNDDAKDGDAESEQVQEIVEEIPPAQ